MSEAHLTALPQLPLLFHSLLPRERRVFIPDSNPRRRGPRLEKIALRVVFHLALTSLVFLSLVTLVWGVSWAFHAMHSIHAFSDSIFRLLDRLETLLAYADVLASATVLLNAIGRHIVETIRGDS